MNIFCQIVYRIVICIGLTSLSFGCSYTVFEKEFINLPEQGHRISLDGQINIDQQGGHLQGIQRYSTEKETVLLLSGSSDQTAFIVQAKLDEEASIISADTLMIDPFRHAGGFQIFENYLAIGIEDNRERNTSQVLVYDLEKEVVWSEPVQRIYREGAYERSTAGAVGMTSIKEHYLIVVADWDSRNLDFYLCPRDQFDAGEDGFHKIGSLATKGSTVIKGVSSPWRPYQNINLFYDANDRLYLVGFGIDDDDRNVADLYRVKFEVGLLDNTNAKNSFNKSISLTRIASKEFKATAGTSFRWGAGLHQRKDGGFILLTSPEHVNSSSNIGVYKN